MTEAQASGFQPYVDPAIELYKRDVDRTLLLENLRLTHEERLRNLMALQAFAEELKRAGQAASGPGDGLRAAHPVVGRELG